MPRPRTLLLTVSTVAFVLLLTAFFLPLIMERTISFWLGREAEKSGATLTIGSVRAPLLRPVELRDIRVGKSGVNASHIEATIPHAEAQLNLLALFGASRGHPIRFLRLEGVTAIMRGRSPAGTRPFDWSTFATLLPDAFEITAPRLLLEQASGSIEIRDARISAFNHRNGELSAAVLAIRAPLFRREFQNVRGLTRWQDDRLTLAAITLLDGFTLENSTFDLSRLAQQRLANDLSIRTFGGTMRLNVATERDGNHRVWDAAGSASGISLETLATALGALEPIRGSLRASKFTFRGDPRDLVHASGSIWMELAGFSWRGRSAESIMLGTTYYARTIQVQELFIKQQENELTVSGETNLGANWLSPDFRGDVNASIADLSAFAELFGAAAGDFREKYWPAAAFMPMSAGSTAISRSPAMRSAFFRDRSTP